jgi:ADP-ribose pyrophosphatase YjhB (NUDIX family)
MILQKQIVLTINNKMERHFEVTVYVFDPRTKNFLFIDHKKLKKWLPPGGHVENNESPEDTAHREVLEETGLKIKLLGDKFPKGNPLHSPFGLQLNIIKSKHEHLDIIYLANPKNKKLTLNQKETLGINWFSIEEIENKSF